MAVIDRVAAVMIYNDIMWSVVVVVVVVYHDDEPH
jgi:hypothetical protein